MKPNKTLLFLIIINLFYHSNTIAQDFIVSTEISLLKGVNKEKRNEYGIAVIFKNNTKQDIYLPNHFLKFNEQSSDSIIIYKKVRSSFEKFKVIKGKSNKKNLDNRVFAHNLDEFYNTVHAGKYFYAYKSRKEANENIINEYEQRIKIPFAKSFSPFFLKAGEDFVLYTISTIAPSINEPGIYKMEFIYETKTVELNLPDYILSYEKFSPKYIMPSTCYFEAKKQNDIIVINTRKSN